MASSGHLGVAMSILFAAITLVAASPKSPLLHKVQHRGDGDSLFQVRSRTPLAFTFCRGGSAEPEKQDPGESHLATSDSERSPDSTNSNATAVDTADRTQSLRRRPVKVRHTPEAIWKLLEKHGVKEESQQLRQMITSRADQYLDDLAKLPAGEKIPDPLGVLHDIAPKIPAIRHSPSFILRITSATSDVDAGAAACAIGAIARLCEVYDKQVSDENGNIKSIASVLIKDRRFEQLVECVLCGVHVKKRKREGLDMTSETGTATQHDIETLLDGESRTVDQGLTVIDSCRAAWGLSILGGYNIETFGDENTHDILTALSLLTRELLLGRLKKLRHGEVEPDTTHTLSLTQRFNRDAESIAEDAATAMWTFACVKACTGLRSVLLFETCCSILCQNPTDLRLRAQANKTGFDDANFEVNDVVERLALSETQTASAYSLPEEIMDTHTGNESRDTLIDWLSPNEVTDAIWSLALHGSTDDMRLKQQKTLSETSAVFREVAFDRLREWLQKDLDDLQQAQASEKVLKHPDVSQIEVAWGSGDDSTVIEVVDAAVILAMERSAESMVSSIESISVKDGSDGEVEELQVVDAASLLAAADPESIPRVETEIIVTSSSNLRRREQLTLSPRRDCTFSPYNLCAIAWAVTDLNDSLQGNIVDLIVDIFMLRGSDRSAGLVGGNLANLAWAIAKRADIETLDGSEINPASYLAITDWIIQQGLSLGNDCDNLNGASRLLQHLQPPEIGRLVWSIAMTKTLLLDTTMNVCPEACRLATLCLRVAASNLSVFGTEDLARIAWAFLKIHLDEDKKMDPTISESLGQILSIVETSLLRWESGQQPASVQFEDHARFSSFLGRPRMSSPSLLDQRVGEFDEDEVVSITSEKSSLPLIRDLATDPATLCKFASTLSQYAAKYPEINEAWTIARVAVRLLVSKNGTLMKETSMRDIISLSVACASNKILGHGREAISRLYAKRVVELLNDVFDVSTDNQVAVTSLLKVSSQDVCNLVWSLGELGIRFDKKGEKVPTGKRKFSLVTNKFLLTEHEIATLSTASLARFLTGLISMDDMSSDILSLARALREFDSRGFTGIQHSSLCSMVENLAKARRIFWDCEKSSNTKEPSQPPPTEKVSDDPAGSSRSSGESITTCISDEQVLRKEVLGLIRSILANATTHAAQHVASLSPEQLRRLLMVVTVSPLDAHPFVEAVERELLSRTAHRSESLKSLRSMLTTTAECAARARSLLSSKSGQDDSPLTALKSGLWSLFFQAEQGSGESSDQWHQHVQEINSLLNEAMSHALYVANRLETIGVVSGNGIDDILETVMEGSNFELGRCKELVAAYRRIDFQTGTRTSRYDKERRMDIGKRLLSRRFL